MNFALRGASNEECRVLKVAPSTLSMFEEAPGHDAVDWTQDAVVDA